MPRILIINVYSTLNKGDAAIVMSQIQALRAACPEAEITVQSWNPETDGANLDCPVVGPFFDMVSERHPEWGPLRRHYHTASLFVKTWAEAKRRKRKNGRPGAGLPAGTHEALDAYEGADLVVSVGGNFLYAYPGHNSFSFLKHCHQLLIAQAMGKPVVMLAQSLGPLDSPLFRRLLRRIVNRCKLVFVREELSAEFLRTLGCRKEHVGLTPDSAFLLSPAPAEEAGSYLAGAAVPDGPIRIGVSVRHWEYPGSADPDAQTRDYVQTMADTLDWMIETWDATVIVFPQCISPSQDDRTCARAIYEQTRHQDRVILIEEDLDPSLIKALYGRMDLFVGTRMHANILATAMFTPTLAISYQPKTDGIMRMLGMEERKLPIADLTSEALRQKLTALWADREDVRGQLRQRIAELQERARHDVLKVVGVLGLQSIESELATDGRDAGYSRV
jgi:colanic acid/amylovoran biosynthesis protein